MLLKPEIYLAVPLGYAPIQHEIGRHSDLCVRILPAICCTELE